MSKLQQEYTKFQEELIKMKEKLEQHRDLQEEAALEVLEEMKFEGEEMTFEEYEEFTNRLEAKIWQKIQEIKF